MTRTYLGPDSSQDTLDFSSAVGVSNAPGASSSPDSSSSPDLAEHPLTRGLNPAQKEAVIHEGPPLLVMAGAGSGKTRVLTHRIAHTLATGQARPGEILAITFTNKAAAEMRDRVQKLVGPRGRAIWVSTFHSACVRLLREHHDAAGLKSTFSIYDAQDSMRLMTMVLKDMNVDTKRFTPRFVTGKVSDLKNELIGPKEFANTAPSDPVSQLVANAYTEYQKRLTQANALDFDDLIMKTVEMVQEHPGVKEGLHRRFRHILVDEYQDTNHAQYVLVRELVGDGKDGVAPAQLTVVGDSDQSIYAFRGASIRNIEEFEQDYQDAAVVFLEQNYRSTQSILEAANSVIAKNAGRRPKRLWTAEGQGEKVVVEVGETEHDEARLVVAELDRLSDAGVDWGDIALFYRTNAQSRALEDRLMRAGIPYRIVGGTRFYERAEVKDALAYLQAVLNLDDVVALRRIINTPRRGIGDKAQGAIAAHAQRYGISFGEALKDADPESDRPIDGLAARAATQVAKLSASLEKARQRDLAGDSPAEILDELLQESGYTQQLQESLDPQDASRLDNLAELVSVAEDFYSEWNLGLTDPDVPRLEGQTPLGGLLERISLIADSDQVPQEDERSGQVTMMTVHTAKGLEFPYVFVTGLEDGTFPHRRSMDSVTELAEERRLAYVALTRARKRLYLTRAASRSSWGAPEDMPPSRFLDDLPEEIVEVRALPSRATAWGTRDEGAALFSDSQWGGYGESSGPAYGSGGYKKEKPLLRKGVQREGGVRRRLGASTSDETDPKLALEVGDRVTHATLGEGLVTGTQGSGRAKTANISFPSGTKRLLLRMAPIAKVE